MSVACLTVDTQDLPNLELNSIVITPIASSLTPPPDMSETITSTSSQKLPFLCEKENFISSSSSTTAEEAKEDSISECSNVKAKVKSRHSQTKMEVSLEVNEASAGACVKNPDKEPTHFWGIKGNIARNKEVEIRRALTQQKVTIETRTQESSSTLSKVYLPHQIEKRLQDGTHRSFCSAPETASGYVPSAHSTHVLELLDAVFGPVSPRNSIDRLQRTMTRFEGREKALIKTLKMKVSEVTT